MGGGSNVGANITSLDYHSENVLMEVDRPKLTLT